MTTTNKEVFIVSECNLEKFQSAIHVFSTPSGALVFARQAMIDHPMVSKITIRDHAPIDDVIYELEGSTINDSCALITLIFRKVVDSMADKTPPSTADVDSITDEEWDKRLASIVRSFR